MTPLRWTLIILGALGFGIVFRWSLRDNPATHRMNYRD